MRDGARNRGADVLRGICIYLMVAGHYLQPEDAYVPFFHVIYSFHMPLLFFLSAFVEEKRSAGADFSPGRMLWKRLRGIVLPYVFWFAFHQTALSVGAGAFSFDAASLFGIRESGFLWFLPVLFLLKLMHAAFLSATKSAERLLLRDALTWAVLAGLAGALWLLSRNHFVKNVISYQVPYAAGILAARHPRCRRLLSGALPCVAALVLYGILFSFFDMRHENSYAQAIRIGMSLCVICVVLFLSGIPFVRRLAEQEKLFAFCGRYSLAVYILHRSLMILLNLSFPEQTVPRFAAIMAASLLITCFCAAVRYAFGKVLSFFAGGRKRADAVR